MIEHLRAFRTSILRRTDLSDDDVNNTLQIVSAILSCASLEMNGMSIASLTLSVASCSPSAD